MLNNDHESFAAAQARAAAAVSCESVVLPSGLTVLCRTMPGYSSVHFYGEHHFPCYVYGAP